MGLSVGTSFDLEAFGGIIIDDDEDDKTRV